MTQEKQFMEQLSKLFTGDKLFEIDLEKVREMYVQAGAMIHTRMAELENNKK